MRSLEKSLPRQVGPESPLRVHESEVLATFGLCCRLRESEELEALLAELAAIPRENDEHHIPRQVAARVWTAPRRLLFCFYGNESLRNRAAFDYRIWFISEDGFHSSTRRETYDV